MNSVRHVRQRVSKAVGGGGGGGEAVMKNMHCIHGIQGVQTLALFCF